MNPKQIQIFYTHVTHVAAAKSNGATIDAHLLTITFLGAGELVVEYSIWKSMILLEPSVELKQFSLVTSGTSFGSAKVISAHCFNVSFHEYNTFPQTLLTLYSAAPCCANSMIWIVALSPICGVKFAGSGT
jgi:energy-converting hydrogenase Eha subunit H